MQEQNSFTKATNSVKKLEKDDSLPNVMMKKERNYQGMFEYRTEDESHIVKHLIYGKLFKHF